jgi:hypothetical protein
MGNPNQIRSGAQQEINFAPTMFGHPKYTLEIDFDAFEERWHVSVWSADHALVSCLGHAVSFGNETRESTIVRCVACVRKNRREAFARWGRR